MEDPVNFSIGQPGFDVPDVVKEAAIKAIRDGENKYSQTAGDAGLIRRIAEQVKGEFGWDRPSVLVASGLSGGLLLAFMALIDPGDEVIIPDPYFVIYKHVTNMLGGRCVFVNSYPDFRLPVDAIAGAITDRTKMIICNSPANPTGVVYTGQELETLAKVAAQKDIVVLSDEIYEKFCYDGPCPSIAKYYDKTLLMRGFSKSYGMPGWRMGYVAANEALRDVVEEMTKLQQYTFVCAPTPFQKAAIVAMDCDVSDLVARAQVDHRRIVAEEHRVRISHRNACHQQFPAGNLYRLSYDIFARQIHGHIFRSQSRLAHIDAYFPHLVVFIDCKTKGQNAIAGFNTH